MEITLTRSQKKATIRDFVPHRVVLAYNEAMFKGVQITSMLATPTKEELLQEFGAAVVSKLDTLSEAAYQREYNALREAYVSRKMEMEGMSLGNIQEANLRRLEGMVTTLDGQPCKRADIEDLPHQDVEQLLSAIAEVSDDGGAKKA